MTPLAGANCLVTGGRGYVGTSLLRQLVPVTRRVRCLSRSSGPPLLAPALNERVEWMVGDVRKQSDVERAMQDIDVVFHLASQTSVYVADQDPRADLEANVLAVLHLLEAGRTGGRRPTILLAGTATQVGLAPRLPVDESFPDAPVSIYDVHKLMGEQYVEYYARRGFVRGATLRLANVYGPGPRSSKPERGVLNTMIRRALAGEPLKLYGPGEFVRDYIYVEDVARAFVLAASSPDAVDGRHFILGTGESCLLRDAVQRVADIVGARTGKPVRIEQVEPPSSLSPIESRHFVADISALRQALAFAPEVSLEEGIRRTMEEFLREQESRP